MTVLDCMKTIINQQNMLLYMFDCAENEDLSELVEILINETKLLRTTIIQIAKKKGDIRE